MGKHHRMQQVRWREGSSDEGDEEWGGGQSISDSDNEED